MAKAKFNTTITLNPVSPEEFLGKVDTLAPMVPEFVQLTKEESIALARLASVDPAFIQDAISAIGASEPLHNAIGVGAPELQQEVELTARWESAGNRLEAILKGVQFGVKVRRHRLGLMAAQTHQLARALARRQENAELLPYVEKLTARNKLGKRRSAKTAEKAAKPAAVPPVSLVTL
jgi:hypothetical protein